MMEPVEVAHLVASRSCWAWACHKGMEPKTQRQATHSNPGRTSLGRAIGQRIVLLFAWCLWWWKAVKQTASQLSDISMISEKNQGIESELSRNASKKCVLLTLVVMICHLLRVPFLTQENWLRNRPWGQGLNLFEHSNFNGTPSDVSGGIPGSALCVGSALHLVHFSIFF